MSPDITIRKATDQDIDRIVRISNAGGPEGKPRKDLPDVLPEGYYKAFQRIVSDPNQFLMVAELDGKIIGTFHVTYLTYLPAAGQEDCQIENVHVEAKCRGKGIGSLMMKWTIDHAKKRSCRRVQLTTDKKRKDAHRFYERLGFALTHEGAKLILDT
jgi:GNAT superfamily N-acetyltransferase